MLEKETINVFKVFDPTNTGFISIVEFMSSFIPELNPRRRAVIEELLNTLESGTGGKITYTTIKKVFNPRGHPDFISNVKADYQIKDDFYLVLDTFLKLTVGVNDYIGREVMLQFFEIYSYAYVDDDYFENIIKGVFRMSKFDPKKSHYEDRDTRSLVSEKEVAPKRGMSSPFGTDNQGALPGRP